MAEQDWTRIEAKARALLDRHGGVAKMRMFVAAEISNHQVAALTARGVLERPRNGWYVDPALPWRAKQAIKVGGILACVSAAESYGLPVPPGWWLLLHVLMPQNAARVRHHRDKRHYVVPGEDREVVLHYASAPGPAAGWRTPLQETLVHLGQCVPTGWFVAAVDAALHRPRDSEPMLTAADLRDVAADLSPQLQTLLRRTNPLAGSCIESLLRLGLEDRGVGWVALQFQAHPLHRVDFLLRDRLIIEADGEAFHDPATDAVRDAQLRAIGYRVLRFSYERIVNDLEAVLDEIEAALVPSF